MTLRLVALALIGISPQLLAGDNGLQVITLKDSSVIRAQVTEMSGGFYLLKSPALGDMRIPTGEVVSIRGEGAPAQNADVPVADSTGQPVAASAQPTAGSASLESLRSALSSKVQSLVSTSAGMNAVMDFSKNPDLKAVLNDPQVMQAIQNGDYNALMKSHAMKNLLDNPQTQSLIQSVMRPHDTPQMKPAAEAPAAPTE